MTSEHLHEGKTYRILVSVAMYSGNATFFNNLQDAFGEMKNIDVTWLPLEADPMDLIGRIPPFSWNGSLQMSAVARHRIKALEKSGKTFDAALFHHQILTLFLGEFAERVPYVITTDATPELHSAYGKWYEKGDLFCPESIFHQLKKWPISKTFQRASFVLPFSDWARRSVVSYYETQPEKVVVVPPGINLRLWKVSSSRQGRMGRTNILFVGGDFMRKGGDLVLSLAGMDEFQLCDFHFVTRSFTGHCPPNVVIHDSVCANSSLLLDLYRQADIFVLPTRSDFHSIASLEAMAMHLPVIATPIGGIPEIIEEGGSGYLVPVDDRQALIQRMKLLVDSPERRICMGQRGRQIVEERFNLSRTASTLAEFLKRAADKT
ncbi:MAG TPA: hypothetical protein DGH68_13270 [Bacteroidetes bacterium]|jgi:glycosyltransferase involved in cell wall biosynthesis|nr:hypothetical protein [Bacteroidota bacterium]